MIVTLRVNKDMMYPDAFPYLGHIYGIQPNGICSVFERTHFKIVDGVEVTDEQLGDIKGHRNRWRYDGSKLELLVEEFWTKEDGSN